MYVCTTSYICERCLCIYYLCHYILEFLSIDFLAWMFCVFFSTNLTLGIRTKDLHSIVRQRRPVVVPSECPQLKTKVPTASQTESPRTATEKRAETVADPGFANGEPKSSAAGSSIEAPKAPRAWGVGENPSPLRKGPGERALPLPRKFFGL